MSPVDFNADHSCGYAAASYPNVLRESELYFPKMSI